MQKTVEEGLLLGEFHTKKWVRKVVAVIYNIYRIREYLHSHKTLQYYWIGLCWWKLSLSDQMELQTTPKNDRYLNILRDEKQKMFISPYLPVVRQLLFLQGQN